MPGRHRPEANAPSASLARGTYAAHTLNLNRGSIGIAVCAMRGAKWARPDLTDAPVTAAQVEALAALTATLCVQYGIPVSGRTVLSHAEVQGTLGVVQRGKWDFDYGLPGVPATLRDPVSVGDGLRAMIRLKLFGRTPELPAPPARVLLRRGSTGPLVAAMQRALGIRDDGNFGPATEAAVVAFQRRNSLLPDGIAGPVTLSTLGIKET